MKRFKVLGLLLIMSCGSGVESAGPELVESDSALNGNLRIDAQCGNVSGITTAVRNTQILGGSTAFRGCVREAMRARLDVDPAYTHVTNVTGQPYFGPYVPCAKQRQMPETGWELDPLYLASIDLKIANALSVATSPNALYFRCFPDASYPGVDGMSDTEDVGAGEEEVWLNNTTVASSAPLFTAGTVLHEVSHQHLYHHPDGAQVASACGVSVSPSDPDNDLGWGRRHTLPYLFTDCALYTWERQEDLCATSVPCPNNDLLLPDFGKSLCRCASIVEAARFGAPAVVHPTSTSLEVLAVGDHNRVQWSDWQQSIRVRRGNTWVVTGHDWTGLNDQWRPIGNFYPMGGPVAAVARGSIGQVDAFVIGTNGVIFNGEHSQAVDWSDTFTPITGGFPPGGFVEAISRDTNQLDVFAVGNFGQVYAGAKTDGGVWLMGSIGGSFSPGVPISATSRHPGNIDLFAIKDNGEMRTTRWQDGPGWLADANWWPLPGKSFHAGSRVGAVARSYFGVDIFAVASDQHVYRSHFAPNTESWGPWTPLDGTFPLDASVTAISRSNDVIDLFITAENGAVYTTSWSESAPNWTSWVPIGGSFPRASPIAATARATDQLDLFVTGTEGRVYTSSWNPTTGWTSVANGWRPIGGFFPVR